MSTETVLLVGATGNIGVSMAIAVLRSKRQVLALVRNQASAEKLYKYLGTREGVTTVEVDVMSDGGIQSVVDRVKTGELPSFQHVFSSGGGDYVQRDLSTISLEYFRQQMTYGVEVNFLAYRATVPYLIAQGNPKSTWTICTGAQGDWGLYQMPAIAQGALFSMSAVAAQEQKETNVRFNELYLAYRVEVDDDADAHGVVRASDFGVIYERLLERPDIRGMRVKILDESDIADLKFEPKGMPVTHTKE
ncbi:hypothetical protein PFICI_02470 [Pestalotiopsis fici W106-1]|uniref:NmrA-like domain-containing protein n=1 Tax=Pestalotiopsis fici (strain W106-1 / CGMCC3.15140) TaxID=1229662 RepID=W3XEG7_PESFW|nr:uncharacterized protein PFICI_02470 [Pestalotiopsis fici W106-1]ETS84445.1 hypothetical protein PFICI_02470 [Pestalotiopsis fici W106-1]